MPEMDYDAFCLFYERHWKQAYKYAKKILEDPDVAADIVQQVFLSLWERRRSLQLENAEAFLIKAVKFACLTELKRMLRYDNPENIENVKLGSAARADDRLLYKDTEEAINGMLGSLGERSHKIFWMRFEQGLDNRTIAAHLDLSEKTVRNKLSEILGFIRKKLKRYDHK